MKFIAKNIKVNRTVKKTMLVTCVSFLLIVVFASYKTWVNRDVPSWKPGAFSIVPKSYLTGSKPVTQQAVAEKKQEELPTARINSTSEPTPDMSISKNQERLLELTSPLYDKYKFLYDATGLSIPFFEGIYQNQQSSVVQLQNLQSIEYRSDVANVLAVVQDESSRLLKVIAQVKDLQDYAKSSMWMLVAVNKEYGSAPMEEDFIKFVNDETIKVDDYIYMFNPKNPDSLGNVVHERDTKTTELELALIKSIRNTR